MPEVVTEGITGLIGETDDDLVSLCTRVDQIDRAVCRREVVRRFSPRAMVDGYEAIYRTVTGITERAGPKMLALADFSRLDEVDGRVMP